MSILKGLFVGMGKVIPYFKMTPEIANQLHSALGKVMLIAKSQGLKLTKKQQDYIIDQTKQLDLYEKSMTPAAAKGPKAEVVEFKPSPESPYGKPGGWMPTEEERKGIMANLNMNENLISDTIDLLKSKTDPKDLQAELKKIIGRKGTYADYSDEEVKAILDSIEESTKKQIKSAEEFIDEGDFDPSGFKDGGRIGFSGGKLAKKGLEYALEKLGKQVTTADKIARPEKAKLKEMFDAFNERFKKKTRASRKEYERKLNSNGGLNYLMGL